MMKFDLPQDNSSIIKVIGVGGGGGNAAHPGALRPPSGRRSVWRSSFPLPRTRPAGRG